MKKQPKNRSKRRKSVPSKSEVKKTGATRPPRQRDKSRSSYTAYINSKGKRVKAGAPGARPIQVKIAREKLAASQTRIEGIKRKQRQATAQRVAIRQAAARKAAVTRSLGKLGIRFIRDTVTEHAHYRYREYQLPDTDSATILAVIQREAELGAAAFLVAIEYADADGNGGSMGTGFFLVRPDDPEQWESAAFQAEISVAEMSRMYEVATMDQIWIKFTYARKQKM